MRDGPNVLKGSKCIKMPKKSDAELDSETLRRDLIQPLSLATVTYSELLYNYFNNMCMNSC